MTSVQLPLILKMFFAKNYNSEVEYFVWFADEHNISCSEVTKPANQVFYYDQSCEIKIIKLEV